MPGIVVDRLCIDFPLYHGQSRSLKRQVGKTLARFAPSSPSAHLMHDLRERTIVSVLREISFTLNSGERLGLIGSNGAGKTTLLRALAGIYEPVAGRVQLDGTMRTLLDSSLGMNPELTGRENIRLKGRYEGLSRQQIERIEQDVQDFAELGPYMDMPMKVYSAGMSVRLAFGLATASSPQILLMDEWFLAGDGVFMNKAKARLEELVQQAEILVLSTHQPKIMRQWCTRVIWLENGHIRMDGTPDEVLDVYLEEAG
ncbi:MULTISPECIES: ABC transporter ATP-binding protein [Gluconobacter]|uniref:ABC transporter ATP-binding protein n=2 Tax=Gluconobacter TaxID=441 RepID=A0ABR9YUG1_9PROT|nr:MULTISPECIES: ABC transporter ATP-binding protein [Gluconobacter]MBF0887883.1 ABC transporter ATP-binding protein [Gluconobacter cadivus]MBN3865882.1 ABC transporter ATP-binding protein [Gluconobacter kondonii]MBS1058954.1 ABC transporter ATP-binding protein [Gluconobacter sp. Dm-44]MCP1236028.1 ABC transporter ATP-binding protein [Gluconobacter kondonii]GBR33672.1 O-antigen exporter ATP-binding protein [Gluconobacter kondonii NBRC 3266]